uniref:Uncharacterized protein n=1 Tax=Piliocolobus tephrosceles TaxID=591936 RepID=A0A8C9IU25_9PRIM
MYLPPQYHRLTKEKLKQEEELLSCIQDNLEKSEQLTKNMMSILSAYDSHHIKLENSIIPVHKQTDNLQWLQDNLEKTLSILDHIISSYHVASDTYSPDSPELNKVKVGVRTMNRNGRSLSPNLQGVGPKGIWSPGVMETSDGFSGTDLRTKLVYRRASQTLFCKISNCLKVFIRFIDEF